MKKALAIVLCVLAVCFASCNKEKEKPNQKFVGCYNGNICINATISAEGQLMPIDSIEAALSMDIQAGEKDNEITAICRFEEEERTLNGTVTENNVDFEPITIYENQDGIEVRGDIHLKGVLNGTMLDINGDVTGSGNITIELLPAPIPVTLSGTITGTLNQTDVIQ